MKLELPKITVWRAIFAAILLSGLYATYLRVFYGLGGSTNLSDKFPWGLWIGFDVMCGVGLAAGGFTLVAMVHIFNIEKYKPVLRPAILTAFLGYILVVVGLLYDLGRPDRLWHPLVMWNPHSVMFEVAWCVTLYTTVLFLEFLPDGVREIRLHKPLEWIHKISVPLMILGVLLSTLHQSSLGTLFLIVPEKLYPLWYTPAAAAAVLHLGHRGGAGHDHFRILAQQPRLRPRAGTAAAGQHGARAGGGAARIPVDPLPGPGPPRRPRACCRGTAPRPGCSCWRSAFMAGAHRAAVPGGASGMRPGALYACAVMVVFGFIANRLNVGITGLEAGSGTHYIPKWSEVAVTLSIVAAGFATFRVIAQYFPIFEAHSHEHAPAEVEETEADPVAVG